MNHIIKPMTYYNTNKETGEVLEKSREKAKSQEERILAFIEKETRINTYKPLTAPHWIANKFNIPITSARRALTNLTKAGKLEKTDVMVIGPYGKAVHTWRLKK